MASINETADWDASINGSHFGYITPGHTISGALFSADDVDWIRVPMAAQQSYKLSLSGAVSAYLTDLGNTWNFLDGSLTHTASHPSSRYFVVISSDETASYTLSVGGLAADGLTDEAGATPTSARNLTLGGSVGGVINGNDKITDTDWFKVTLKAGESYNWTMSPTNSVVGATGGGFLKLFDVSGAEMGTTWSASAWNDGASLSFTPTVSGIYYVEAATYPGFTDAGSYVLQMERADSEARPTISLGDATATEGNSGTTSVALTLSLSQAAINPVTVSYRTVDGTAISGGDYLAIPGASVTFATGETNKVLTFSVTGDTTAEGNEDFYVQITDATEAKLSAASGIFATVTISDDDSAPNEEVTIEKNSVDADLAVVQRGVIGKGVGSDSYILSPRLVEPKAQITLSDTGNNTLHLLDGLEIAAGKLAPNALLLTLNNGAEITILDANDYSYVLGGDPLTDQADKIHSFQTLASDTLGKSVPSSGISEFASVTIGGSPFDDPALDLDSTMDTVVVQRGIVGKGQGEDTYVLAQAWLHSNPEVTITDTGTNTIQFIDGLELASSMVASNAMLLTLVAGGTVTVLDASDYTYVVGGNPLLNGEGTPLSFMEFAEQILRVEFPKSSQISNGEGVTISESLLIDENLVDVVDGIVAQGSDGADTFVFALSSGGNFEIQGFDISQDQLSLSDLSEVDGSVLADIVGDTGLGGEIITAQYDPFAGSLFVNLGIDPNGEIVSLNLAGLSDQDLSSVQLAFV